MMKLTSESPASSTPQGRVTEAPTPVANKAAREGNPQQLLEKLPAMLHGVMIQCADVFNNPSRQHARTIMHTNAVLRHSVPATVDRFQQTLDMLEIEILKAKAVLHRDLTKFHTAAELARQKELEEERRIQLEREAEARRVAEEKARIESERLEAENQAAAAAAAAEAAAAALAASQAAAADLDMAMDDASGLLGVSEEPKDPEMDKLFEDVQDVESLKVEDDGSHDLETSNLPLVAAAGQVGGVGMKIKAEDVSPGAVAATFEDPIVLDSPMLPAEGNDDEPQSAVDLFGEDPLNPTGDVKDPNATAGRGVNLSIEDQIDMDLFFEDHNEAAAEGGDASAGGDNTHDDLFGELEVAAHGGDDASKLDIMNLDIPGLGVAVPEGEEKPGDPTKAGEQAQAEVVPPPVEIDINSLTEGNFDELLASFGDEALLGNDNAMFDDAFMSYGM